MNWRHSTHQVMDIEILLVLHPFVVDLQSSCLHSVREFLLCNTDSPLGLITYEPSAISRYFLTFTIDLLFSYSLLVIKFVKRDQTSYPF